MLTGFWHGAEWNFVLWGLYFFIFLVAEKLFLGKILKKLLGKRFLKRYAELNKSIYAPRRF